MSKYEDPAKLSALEAQVRENPDDIELRFELGGAFDSLGREAEALPHYFAVQAMGIDRLPEAERPPFYLQTGSTLRNVDRIAESRALLAEGCARYPEYSALWAFAALTEYTDGQFAQSARYFMRAAAGPDPGNSLKRCARALGFYRDQMDTFPRPPTRRGTLHHVELYVSNLARTRDFWSWILERLGYRIFQQWDGGVSFIRGETYLVFVQAEGAHLEAGYHRERVGLNHLAFHADSEAEIAQWRTILREHGVGLLYDNDAPNEVFFEDPDRFKIEIAAKPLT